MGASVSKVTFWYYSMPSEGSSLHHEGSHMLVIGFTWFVGATIFLFTYESGGTGCFILKFFYSIATSSCCPLSCRGCGPCTAFRTRIRLYTSTTSTMLSSRVHTEVPDIHGQQGAPLLFSQQWHIGSWAVLWCPLIASCPCRLAPFIYIWLLHRFLFQNKLVMKI